LAVEKELEELVASGDTKKSLNLIIDKLLEKPDWFDKIIADLDQADQNFLRAMPCGFFPPIDQIEEGVKVMTSKEWTPTMSAAYWLKAIQAECPKKTGEALVKAES